MKALVLPYPIITVRAYFSPSKKPGKMFQNLVFQIFVALVMSVESDDLRICLYEKIWSSFKATPETQSTCELRTLPEEKSRAVEDCSELQAFWRTFAL